MKKIHAILAAALLFAAQPPLAAARSQPAQPRVLLYGHAYLKDQNTPLPNLVVEVVRDGKTLATSKTDRSGLYQAEFGTDAKSLNVCVRPTAFSDVKAGGFCETVSVFQKVAKIVGEVEVRDLEHDFFMDEKGANLNALYEKEITNRPQEEAFTEYQKSVQAAKEAAEKAKAAKEAADKAAELKAKYRMPPNTVMTGPLMSMRIMGSVSAASGTLDPSAVTVAAISAQGEEIARATPGAYGDFSLDVLPQGAEPFLNPVAVRVSSVERAADGKGKAWDDAWFRAASETVIVNAKLVPYSPGPLDAATPVPAGFPWLLLPAALGFAAALFASAVSFRLRIRRKDA